MDQNDEMARNFFHDGVLITASVTIQRPPRDIYAFWSGLTGLSQVMSGFELVVASNGRVIDFQVRAKASESGLVKWQAEILNEEPDKMIAWRSIGTPAVPNAGSINLRELPFSRGTEVKVLIDYIPPKGDLLQRVRKTIGPDPRAFLQLTLFRLRQLLETGELATTRGQPAGRSGGRDDHGSEDEHLFAAAENHS